MDQNQTDLKPKSVFSRIMSFVYWIVLGILIIAGLIYYLVKF